jgi:hypothetical protein
VRGLHRLASLTKASAAAKELKRSDSAGSGGWRNDSVVDEEEEHRKEGDRDSRMDSKETFLTAEEEEELRIPGSFDMSNPQRRRGRSGSADDDGDDDDDDDDWERGGGAAAQDESWAGLFRRMGLH